MSFVFKLSSDVKFVIQIVPKIYLTQAHWIETNLIDINSIVTANINKDGLHF